MSTRRFRTFLHENSLSLAFGALFLAALAAQAFAGVAEYNDQHRSRMAWPQSPLPST